MFFLKTIVFAILILCSLHFEMMMMTEIENDTTSCSQFIACRTCSENSFCNWSLERQTCVTVSSTHENLTVNNKTNCPQYSLASDRSILKIQDFYRYQIKVSNDVNGFMDFLSGTKIQCDVSTYHSSGKTIILDGQLNGNYIVCDPLDPSDLPYDFLFHCFIKFNNTILRFDDETNHYVFIRPVFHKNTRYGNDRCTGPLLDKDCVTCVWNDKVHVNVFKRCLKSNPCIGRETFYNRRYVQNYTFSDWDSPTAFDCPAVLDISAVEPTSAPWYGATVVTVKVKNHRTLYGDGDLNNITVTVAGRPCRGPRTINGDYVKCTVDAAKTDPLRRGPVTVTYQFEKDAGFYGLTSRQSFGWDYPEVVGSGPACGPLEGGTVLTINGSLLTSGDTALVTVAGNGTCDITSRTDGRILCRTGRAGAPAAGPVTVTFAGPSTRHVRVVAAAAAAAFEYVAGGPALDARQRFGGIVSGGTSLPVRGTRLNCAENPRAYVEHFGVRTEAGCRVQNGSYMVCRAPRLDERLHGAVQTVTVSSFGIVADFAGHTLDLSAGPGSTGYSLYPDPRFTGFGVVGGTVVLYGNELGAGYGPEDVAVRFRNSADVVCAVTLMTGDRVVCEPTTVSDLNGLQQVVVTVGDVYLVALKLLTNSNTLDDKANKMSTRDIILSHDVLMSFGGIIIIIIVVAILMLYFILLRSKNNRRFRVNPEQLAHFKYEKGAVNLIDIEN